MLLMIFCHIIDDYCLQNIGPLASLKQKIWWSEHYPQKLYKYDFLIALIMHSFSWTFMVMLPIAYYFAWNPAPLFYIAFGVNVVVHANVDHAKANRLAINLLMDQTIHVGQIAVTFILLIT